MGDTSITKVSAKSAPTGPQGQRYLAAGSRLSMRMWDAEVPGVPKPEAMREYETLGYVLEGKAELELEGQLLKLEPGDSWVVPRGARHTYRILETFSAVEVTSPPAEAHGRDAPSDARETQKH